MAVERYKLKLPDCNATSEQDRSGTQSIRAFLLAVDFRRDSGIMEFLLISFEFFDWLLAEQQSIQKFQKYSKKCHYRRVSPGDQPPTKKPEDSGFEIGTRRK